MIEWLRFWWSRFFEDRTFGAPRSSTWPRTRREYLKTHPICEVCGTDKNLQVHHKRSFATEPSLEENLKNLMTLCEGMERNCHRQFGHLNNYSSINEQIEEDAKIWNGKIKNRPTWNGSEWQYP